MKFQKFIWFVLPGALAAFGGGCATPAVWDHDSFARYHEPAGQPNVRLFYSSEHKDVLVEYSDLLEDDGPPKRRAFWLEQNAERLSGQHRPHFVSIEEVRGLEPVQFAAAPPGNSVPELSEDLCAVMFTNPAGFTLYCGRNAMGEYKLPIYRAPSSRVKQVLLTPPAVVADTTIVGGAIGGTLALLAAYWFGQCGYTFQAGRWH